MKQNGDGSVDIYFAPRAPEGHEANWIQTIPGKSWFIIFRANTMSMRPFTRLEDGPNYVAIPRNSFALLGNLFRPRS